MQALASGPINPPIGEWEVNRCALSCLIWMFCCFVIDRLPCSPCLLTPDKSAFDEGEESSAICDGDVIIALWSAFLLFTHLEGMGSWREIRTLALIFVAQVEA